MAAKRRRRMGRIRMRIADCEYVGREEEVPRDVFELARERHWGHIRVQPDCGRRGFAGNTLIFMPFS
jgi:hypothetical protein